MVKANSKLKQRIRFIVNPFSGTKDKSDIEKWIKDALDPSRFQYEIFLTQHPSHASELAAQAVTEKIDIVAVLGGDGTVNEVGAALVNTETIMAVLPGGSGNGFAMHLGMGRNIPKAIGLLNEATPVIIDTCLANDRFFINIAGVGFDSMVANESKTDQSRGLFLYVRYTLKKAFDYRERKLKIKIDGQPYKGRFLTVSIANGSMFGYNFKIAPRAILTDGMLDVVMIQKVATWKYFTSFWRFFNQTQDKLSFVNIVQARKIKIRSKKKVDHHVDGEGIGKIKTLEVRIVPKSLKVLVPHN